MNRLTIINFINPSWFKQIIEFLGDHPGYIKLLPIVALDEYPSGFNKNPLENVPNAPANVFETMLYGIAHAGVVPSEGLEEYLRIKQFLKESTVIEQNMPFPFPVNSTKIRTYQSLINILLDNDIIVHEMKFEHMPLAEDIFEVADSTIALVYLLYADVDDNNVIPYSDTFLIKGIEMFYEIENPSRRQIREITDTWANKKVGLMFLTQYAHYSEYVK